MNYLDSMQKAIDFIEENIVDNIELDEIAKAASMSLPHLYRIFYSLTGHPIKEYLRRRRISIASEHLKNSTKTVMDIALECGFESQSSFSKSFKKLVGVTPKVYRESGLLFCFERIDLFQKVNYLEGRDLFDRYPDVKVIQMKVITVLSYIYGSDTLEGIERNAFKEAQKLIQKSNLNSKTIRYFGRNIDSDNHYKSNCYAYEMMIPVCETFTHSIEEMEIKTIQCGLYAVGSTHTDCDQTIISLWNRMYSEWLPKSSFKEGSHTYLEEYITYNEKLVRLKLYMPIERQLKPELITVEEIEPFWVAFSKEYGQYSQDKADRTLSKWLESDTSIDYDKSELYLSYNYGSESDSEHWSEYGITLGSEYEKVTNPNISQKELTGGLFACIETKAYGTLSGVLDIIHRWIVSGDKYKLDGSRQWFAMYHFTSTDSSNSEIYVRSYIPIVERSKSYDGE